MSAPAKPISEVIEDFEQSLESLRPSTRRVYVAGAKAAIRAACLELATGAKAAYPKPPLRQLDYSYVKACQSVIYKKKNPAIQRGLKVVAGVGFEPTAFRL